MSGIDKRSLILELYFSLEVVTPLMPGGYPQDSILSVSNYFPFACIGVVGESGKEIL